MFSVNGAWPAEVCASDPEAFVDPNSSAGGPLVGRAQEFHRVVPASPVTFPSRCVGLLVLPDLALSRCSSAASFSPTETPTKERPQPQIMNKAALPLVPRPLFLGCYKECVLLAKPVMDVGLPLSLCLLHKDGISLN